MIKMETCRQLWLLFRFSVIVAHLICFPLDFRVSAKNEKTYPNSSLLVQPQSVDVQVFQNSTSLFQRQIEFDQSRPYRKRRPFPGAWDSSFSYAGAYGGGNNHYDPSAGKYGGGGPIKYKPGGGGRRPNKGVPPPPPPLQPPPEKGPNYGSSYIPNHILPSLGNHHGGKRPIGGNNNGGSNGGNSGGGGVGGGVPSVPVEGSVNIVVCDAREKCHGFSHCASFSSDYLISKDRCCIRMRKQVKGMCCDGNYPVASSAGKPFNPYSTDTYPVPDISQKSLQTAAIKGYEYQTKYRATENRLLELGIVVERGTSAHGHLLFFQTTPGILHIARENFLAIKATSYIQDTYFLSNSEAGIGLQGYDFGGTIFEKTCPIIPKCERFSKYRTADGSCNNPISAKLGQSSTPLIRLLPPDYADGVWAPRVRKDGSPLPGPRFISLSLVPDVNFPDLRYSHMLMQFGQFVDHDLSHVPILRFPDLSGIQCCGNIQTDVSHPACFPIEIPPNDFNNRGQSCMNFVRSMTAPRLDCSFGHADQLNQLTHWLDASQIYGSTFEQAEALREFSGGRLRISRENNGGREFLPEDMGGDKDCAQATQGSNGHCFIAGDKRVNEQVGLTSIQTIFLREHQRIAFELQLINPHWEDETLYQEARRIVIAEYQHIVYNEFVPLIIGRKYMETFGILPLYEGYYDGYDANIDGRVSNAFTTAAYRMGHTLVQGSLNLQADGGGTVGRLVLRDFFNNPSILPEAGVLDFLTEGLLTQPIQKFDNFVTTELRDHLFETANSPGMDLIALNIQRGRDHGIPSYNEYRDLCRLGKARDFEDLAPIIHPRKISQLERIYGNVDDIDLFIGGIHETALPGAVVGPTFACIIGEQFVRSKRGDFYFHDHGGQPHPFTPAQLHEIRSTSLSRIICDNADDIRSIQPLAFHLPNNKYNPMVPCGSGAIERLNLRAWKE